MKNMLKSLIIHEAIKTTVPKAKAIKPIIDKLIHRAKKGDVASNRYIESFIGDKTLVRKLCRDIAPRFQDRQGGYTRILRVGYRKGDCSPLAIIELLNRSKKEKKKKKEK